MTPLHFFDHKPPALRSVLFVCTANVTRSPAAALIFSSLAEKSGEKWEVASAGIRAGRGYPANPIVTFIMFQRRLSLADHKTKPVNAALLRRYRWIFAMEEAQREFLIKLDPKAAERIFLLRNFGLETPRSDPNMPDPTGKNEEDYHELFEILDREIPRLFRAVEDCISNLELAPE